MLEIYQKAYPMIKPVFDLMINKLSTKCW